jgi:hypothetical protein
VPTCLGKTESEVQQWMAKAKADRYLEITCTTGDKARTPCRPIQRPAGIFDSQFANSTENSELQLA